METSRRHFPQVRPERNVTQFLGVVVLIDAGRSPEQATADLK